jgi:hypothetical protein
MRSQVAERWSKLAGVVVVGLGLTILIAEPSYAANNADIYVVQGLPGAAIDVSVDGHSVAKRVTTAQVVGPFKVGAGTRTVTFMKNGAVVLKSAVTVAATSSTDVVVHLPAQASGRPIVTTFKNDLSAVPRDKASLVVAHTAAVPPADIRVDNQVLFSNVANGESLKLVVPAATYRVAIVPTGETGPALLGPLDLPVKGGSLNRVYAVGDPKNKTMNVAVHVIAVVTAGSAKPHQVNTGTGGQAVALQPAVFADLFH